MLPPERPDRITVAFDDHRLVANAGLILPATLAQHLGLRELVDNHVDLGDAPGRANAGVKLLTLVATALTTLMRCGWRDRAGTGVCRESAIHPRDLPAEFLVGPCAPAGSGESRVAGSGLGGWGRTGR